MANNEHQMSKKTAGRPQTELERLRKLNRVHARNRSETNSSETNRRLVVFVGGLFWSKEQGDYDDLVKLIAETLPAYDVVSFPYNTSVFSRNDPDRVANSLRVSIANLMAEENYTELRLVGHSFGTVLIRAVVLNAHREFGNNPDHWYRKIERLVLLAPTNRGYEPATLMQSTARSIAEYAQWIPMMKVGRQALSVTRGSGWLNNFRLRWIEEFDQADPPPYTVVILGKNDRIVAEDDTVEFYQFTHADKKVVANVGHGHFTLILKPSKGKEDPRKSQQNKEAIDNLKVAIREGLTQSKNLLSVRADAIWPGGTISIEDTQTIGITRGQVPELQPKVIEPPVIFLVHGIRDFAEWQETLGAEIRRQSPGAIVVPVIYGYFTALQFLYRTARLRAMRSFVDRYVQMRAEHPKSTFHVAAHSNGTWVVAYALRNNAAFQFENMYFCGSVLSRLFPWYKLASQINGNVRNDCANGDWPVGVLCSTLSWTPILWWDLGAGGVDGFIHSPRRVSSWSQLFFARRIQPKLKTPPLQNNYYLSGDHGAALRAENHPSIAEFLLGNSFSKATVTSKSPLRSRCCYLFAFAIVTTIVGLVSYWIPAAAESVSATIGASKEHEKTFVLLTIWTLWVLILVSRLIKI